MSGLQRGQREWGFFCPMIWINIKTTTLRESEYISASPTQQATWLKLLAYCSEHENGGVIHGAGGWNERAWLFGCGVMLDEVRDQCGLWRFDGTGSLAVWNYPVEKELEVVAKREAGKRGGQAKAQNRSTACSSATAQPVAQLVAKTDSACSSPPTEGVRSKVEGEGVNGKEEEEEQEWVPQGELPPPAANEEEEEVKPEKEKRAKPGPDPEACTTTLPGNPSAELAEAWQEWQQYRQRRAIAPGRQRVAWTAQAARLSAKQVSQYAASHGSRIVCDRIASAINGEWQGLNLDKLDNPARSGKLTYEEEEKIHKPNPKSIYGF